MAQANECILRGPSEWAFTNGCPTHNHLITDKLAPV